jgi:hypothetical protein
MRRIAVLFAAFCAAVAQEDPRARAREIELEAEKALDEGRRPEALKLLAEAAEIRARARDGTPRPVQEPKAAPAPDPKAAANPPPAQAAEQGLAEMAAELGKGDATAALRAGERTRGALARWARDLEARERRLAAKGRADLEKRLAEIEAALAELRKQVAER